MSFVKLSDGCYVNPTEVQEITINERRDAVTVRMKDGVGHHIQCDYYKGIWETLDRVKADLERRVYTNPVLFDWLEANAEQYGLHGAFARGTGGIDAEFVMRKLMFALSAPPPQPEVEHRHTFVIPPGHEAVLDGDGRATGKTRPTAEAVSSSAQPEVAGLVEALKKVRSYNVDIQSGRINYRPQDHIYVIDAALASMDGGSK